MKFTKLSPWLLVAALALGGCKGKEEAAPQVATLNPLLQYVPAETPYLLANLEPTPASVVDAYLARFKPTLEVVQSLLDDLQVEINPDGSEQLQHAALGAALLHELDGKLNREGIESLGLSLESHKAFYGMGAFPVARVALRDASALRAAVARVEAEAGMSFPELTFGEVSYWKLAAEGQSMALYAAILPDHLAISAFPTGMEDTLLPALLGQTMPSSGFDANAELAALNQAKGFTGFGSGYFDFRSLVAEFMQPDSVTGRGLKTSGNFSLPEFDAVCRSEIGELVDKAPRLVIGTTELTDNTVGMMYQLEMEPGLAGSLAHLVSDVPPARDEGDLLSMSFALQLGRVREFLLERATYRSQNPFQCPQLQEINRFATEGLARLNQPLPPFVGNLNGLRLKLQEIDFTQPSPQTTRGMLVLEVEKPQMLVGSAQMFIPGLENLDLEPGGEPVEVPQELLTVAVDGMHVFAAMSKDALGISLGKDQSGQLLAYLEENGDNGGAFLSVSYDMAAQAKLENAIRRQGLAGMGDDPADADAARMNQLADQLERSYRDMLGRTQLEFRFVPAGIEMHTRVTFK